MKELSLLMFLFGCGWVLTKVVGSFSAPRTRRRHFYIPSVADYNVLWGFIFYFGFAALKLPEKYKIWPLLAIAVLFGFILYFRGLRRSLSHLKSAFFVKDINRRLAKQAESDTRFTAPYTRGEALRALGLPRGADDENTEIAERLQMLEKLAETNPELPYLKAFLNKLKKALFPQKLKEDTPEEF